MSDELNAGKPLMGMGFYVNALEDGSDRIADLESKVDQLYRALATPSPWISEGLGVYRCAYCEHSLDEATLPDEEHADSCLYVEAVEYDSNNPKATNER